jgi:AraC-like DNA-binding protein
MKYIIFASLVQTLVVLALTAFAKNRRTGDNLLLLLLIATGLHLLAKFYIFNVVDNAAVTFRMHTCLQLAYGPLVYLYARKKTNGSFIPARMWYLFIPLIIMVTLYAAVSFGMSRFPGQATAILGFYNTLAFVPIITSHIVYGGLTAILFRHGLAVHLGRLLVALGFAEIALYIAGNINPAYNEYTRMAIYLILGLVPVFMVRDRLDILPVTEMQPKPKKRAETALPKDRKLALPPERQAELFEKLEGIIKDKALYKDEDLSLEKLSEATGLNRHHISETLNVFAQKPFYQYINEYRIGEVLRRLDEGKKKERLLAVAYDCGFKTKASFNQYFKKITGVTPSEYVKQKGV